MAVNENKVGKQTCFLMSLQTPQYIENLSAEEDQIVTMLYAIGYLDVYMEGGKQYAVLNDKASERLTITKNGVTVKEFHRDIPVIDATLSTNPKNIQSFSPINT